MTNTSKTVRRVIVTFKITDTTTTDELLERMNKILQEQGGTVEVVDIEEDTEVEGQVQVATTECFKVKR